MIGPAFQNHVSPGRFEALRSRFAATQSCRDLISVCAGKLKNKCVPSASNGRPHLGRVLIQELIRCNYGNSELPRFREDRVEAVFAAYEILDFVAIEREQIAGFAGEECVLYEREKQTSQGHGFFSQSAFLEIQDDPFPLGHRILN